MKISMELPESTFATFRQTPAEFMDELKLAATSKWYELGRISQAKAAELAGLTRHGFLEALLRYNVSAIQSSPEDLIKELEI
jgi:predicted HTH domain antitoxin